MPRRERAALDLHAQLAALEERALAKVVQRALGGARPRLLSAECAPLAWSVVNPSTGGLFRWSGTARCDGAERRWSVILKVLARPAGAAERSPAHWNYWKREALAYGSGLLEEVGGLRAPRCLGVEDRAPHWVWLWLEDLGDEDGRRWSLPRYALAAQHLGQFGAAHARRPLPAATWLCRDFLRRAYEDTSGALAVLESAAARRSALVRRGLSNGLAERVLRLHAHSALLFEQLAALPQTLCHFDTSRLNLVDAPGPGRGGRGTVLIDWAFLGTGAVGTDLGQLFAVNLLWMLNPPSEAAGLARALVRGYRAGLRRGGCSLPAAQLAFAFGASAGLRAVQYLPFLVQMLLDRSQHAFWRSRFHGTPSQTVGPWGRGVEAVISLAERALATAQDVSPPRRVRAG